MVKLLDKLFIEFTKLRARHFNDNALAESKNGLIIQKNLGYLHINGIRLSISCSKNMAAHLYLIHLNKHYMADNQFYSA